MDSSFFELISILVFVLDFKDPATLYIEGLISVHNNVMWYLIIIITIVYWTLYKIIQDSNWTVFNKQVGFLRKLFLNNIYIEIQSYILAFYEVICANIVSVLNTFPRRFQYIYFSQNKAYFDNFDYFFKFFFYSFDHTIFSEIPAAILPTNAYAEEAISKTLDQLLFRTTTLGYFYFGRVSSFDSSFASRYSPFLSVQQFKHSTLLEVIWATFPSIVILLILVPSILLIYSVDEDLDPEFTIKVTGHQWFWSYEFDGWLPIKGGKIEKLLVFAMPVQQEEFFYDSPEADFCDLAKRKRRTVFNRLARTKLTVSISDDGHYKLKTERSPTPVVKIKYLQDPYGTDGPKEEQTILRLPVKEKVIKPRTLSERDISEFLSDYMQDTIKFSSFEFDSCMVITDSLNLGEHRLLEVDHPLVVPCSVGLRFLITSADVLHAWAIPELGIKVDAVPGRLSQFISLIRRPGVFFGQCSEICGVAHAFMPIVIHADAYTKVMKS